MYILDFLFFLNYNDHIKARRDKMLGYFSTVSGFSNETSSNILKQLIHTYPDAPSSQMRSWEVLIDDIKTSSSFHKLPPSAIISLEFSLCVENMSVDLLISGTTDYDENTAFIIEAKQWSDDYIYSHSFSNYRESDELLHPQTQVYHHYKSLKDYISITPEITHIIPFVYMRNASNDGCVHLCEVNPDTMSKDISIYNNIDEIFDMIADNLSGHTLLTVDSFRDAIYFPSLSIIDSMNAIITH